jgi:hypothetical protein
MVDDLFQAIRVLVLPGLLGWSSPGIRVTFPMLGPMMERETKILDIDEMRFTPGDFLLAA